METAKKVFVPHLGHHVVLVPRDQLRRHTTGRTLRVPDHLRAISIPAPPAAFDGSNGRKVKYPILGNDQYGDCYYADACHCAQTFTSWGSGQETSFDAAAVIKRYLQLSGGDNGLGDAQIFPEWKSGIVGPNGPHKILDDMTVDPRDDNAIKLGFSLFCGGSVTMALPDEWVQNAKPGGVWDTGVANQNNGHAVHASGYKKDYIIETWGFDPGVNLTPAGLRSADPEVTVHFSLEMFNSHGIAPHNNMSYDQLAALWTQLGGQTLPPNPFGNNPPPPPPLPSKLFSLNINRPFKKGAVVSFLAPVAIPVGLYDVTAQAKKTSIAVDWHTVLSVVTWLLQTGGAMAVPIVEHYVDAMPWLSPEQRAAIDALIESLIGAHVTVE